MITPTREILEFLHQSNEIEGEYDAVSLMQSFYAWEYLMDQKKLTLGVVLKTHKILMLHSNLNPDEKGYFRKVAVYVGGREGISWEKIEGALQFWCQRMTKRKEDYKESHVEYEKIHPFIDGNGRTGRMFMNWLRLKQDKKLLTIHAGSEQQQYYFWFK